MAAVWSRKAFRTWSADGAHLNVAEALVLICDVIDRIPEYGDRDLDEWKRQDFVGDFLHDARAVIHDLAPSKSPVA